MTLVTNTTDLTPEQKAHYSDLFSNLQSLIDFGIPNIASTLSEMAKAYIKQMPEDADNALDVFNEINQNLLCCSNNYDLLQQGKEYFQQENELVFSENGERSKVQA